MIWIYWLPGSARDSFRDANVNLFDWQMQLNCLEMETVLEMMEKYTWRHTVWPTGQVELTQYVNKPTYKLPNIPNRFITAKAQPGLVSNAAVHSVCLSRHRLV